MLSANVRPRSIESATIPKVKPPIDQPSKPTVLRLPPPLPISAMLGFPPKSSVKAGRNTSENRPKSVASSDQPAHATKNTSHWYRVTPRTKPLGPPTPSIVPIVLIRRSPFLPGLRRGRLTRHSPDAGTHQGHGLAFGPPAQPKVAQDGCAGERRPR